MLARRLPHRRLPTATIMSEGHSILAARAMPYLLTAVGASLGFLAGRYGSSAPSSGRVPSPDPAECPKCAARERGGSQPSDGDGDGDNDSAYDDVDGASDSSEVPPEVELKMVICVRTDLNMSKGKIAAQVGHAVLASYRIACRITPEFVKAWLFRAQAKITLKVDGEEQMDAIAAEARKAGIACCVIEDAGRTEVEPGTRTVLGIGPAPKADIDRITGPKGKHPLRLLM